MDQTRSNFEKAILKKEHVLKKHGIEKHVLKKHGLKKHGLKKRQVLEKATLKKAICEQFGIDFQSCSNYFYCLFLNHQKTQFQSENWTTF